MARGENGELCRFWASAGGALEERREPIVVLWQRRMFVIESFDVDAAGNGCLFSFFSGFLFLLKPFFLLPFSFFASSEFSYFLTMEFFDFFLSTNRKLFIDKRVNWGK